jgi:aspartyl-tRNA(Asn)/glutamyl-tRNA(Gln) amidotransferase subunit A
MSFTGSSVQAFLRSSEDLDRAWFRSRVAEAAEATDAIREMDHDREVYDGTIAGLPVSVKDNICVEGFNATAGSKILESYRPTFTATAISRLEDAGARVFAKTNQDEFGFGTFSTNSAYEVPKNPHNPDRVTGGSSGGAAALTAELDAPHVAIGQSTGGSISCPAAFCGVVGLTPTYGRVSRYGLIDYANSMDKLGPIARSVDDAALALELMSGEDERDFTTVDRELPGLSSVGPSVEGMRVAVPAEYMEYRGVDEAVRKEIWRSIEALEDRGAEVEEVSLPKIGRDYALPSYYITAMCEASTNLARYCGMRYGMEKEPEQRSFDEYFADVRTDGFGKEAQRRVMLGHFARSEGYRDAYYIKALKVRRLVIEEFKRAFEEYDLLAAPTMPIPAPTFEEAEELPPVEVYAMDTLTVGPNLAGLPQLSLPVGTVDDMPVGMHLIGDHFEEATLVRAGRAYEEGEGLIL